MPRIYAYKLRRPNVYYVEWGPHVEPIAVMKLTLLRIRSACEKPLIWTHQCRCHPTQAYIGKCSLQGPSDGGISVGQIFSCFFLTVFFSVRQSVLQSWDHSALLKSIAEFSTFNVVSLTTKFPKISWLCSWLRLQLAYIATVSMDIFSFYSSKVAVKENVVRTSSSRLFEHELYDSI